MRFLAIGLVLLVAGCGSGQASSQATQSLRRSLPPLVHLPRDQYAHPSVQNEWWYVVGHLHAGARTFGYEVTLFSFRHQKVPGSSTPVSIDREDVAITDEAGKRFLQQISYTFPGSARLSSTSLDERLSAGSLSGSSSGRMHVAGRLPNGSIDLTLAERRPPMYVGGRGYLSFFNGYTYYYSLTDLSSSGRVRLGNRTYRVSGISWLDHQWGNWSWSTVRGWTWMALQLNNGVQLSLFDFRGNGQRVRAASVLQVNGVTETVHGLTIRGIGSWKSPHTGVVYPSSWLVTIPALHARLRVRPTVPDQELFISPYIAGPSTASRYWEGSGRVTGSFDGKPVRGYSYTELTGYAGVAPGT